MCFEKSHPDLVGMAFLYRLIKLKFMPAAQP